MARLELSRRGQRLLPYRLPVTAVTIGREGMVELEGPQISRLHVRLEWQGTRIVVTDTSTFGTRLNGVPMQPGVTVPFRHGDVLEIGAYRIELVVERPPRTAAPTRKRCLGDALVGGSAAMARVREIVEMVSDSRVPVLITGETGTGKGEAARAIHTGHPDGPFISLNAASLVGSLFESELFGHERGAFTGAGARRDGAFQNAHGGTLFLDEIGELPLALQPKLLCALEDRTVRRVGASHAEPVNVRVIAATNRDLERMVAKGTFRDDLYSRLNCVQLAMPPLRERRADIPELVGVLIERATLAVEVSEAAMEALVARDWPDNVRGLRNALERAAVFAREGCIEPHHLDASGSSNPEADKIRNAINASSNEREAAARLGMARSTLKRRMDAYGIPSRPPGRPRAERRPSPRPRATVADHEGDGS